MFYLLTFIYEKKNCAADFFFLRRRENLCDLGSIFALLLLVVLLFLQMLHGTCKTFYNLSPSSRLFFSSLSSQDFVSLGSTPPDRPDPRPIQVFLLSFLLPRCSLEHLSRELSISLPLSRLPKRFSPVPRPFKRRGHKRSLRSRGLRDKMSATTHLFRPLFVSPSTKTREQSIVIDRSRILPGEVHFDPNLVSGNLIHQSGTAEKIRYCSGVHNVRTPREEIGYGKHFLCLVHSRGERKGDGGELLCPFLVKA